MKAMKYELSIRGSKNFIILVERASACGNILYCFKKKKKKKRLSLIIYNKEMGPELFLLLGHLCAPLWNVS